MQINEKLADRIREVLAASGQRVEEKRMFSGLCFMVNDKMCVAASKDSIMVRFDPVLTDELMEKEGCLPMVRTGKIMKGFVFVDEEMLRTKKQLGYWVGLALDFNQFARPSKTAVAARSVKKAAAARNVKKAGAARAKSSKKA